MVITSGCNKAFCVAIDALTQPGDEVILPLPYYVNHHMWLGMRGLTPVLLPFADGRAGVPDPVAAARLIGPRTRAMVLVNPNNPTGAEYPGDVIDAFFDVGRSHNLASPTWIPRSSQSLSSDCLQTGRDRGRYPCASEESIYRP